MSDIDDNPSRHSTLKELMERLDKKLDLVLQKLQPTNNEDWWKSVDCPEVRVIETLSMHNGIIESVHKLETKSGVPHSSLYDPRYGILEWLRRQRIIEWHRHRSEDRPKNNPVKLTQFGLKVVRKVEDTRCKSLGALKIIIEDCIKQERI